MSCPTLSSCTALVRPCLIVLSALGKAAVLTLTAQLVSCFSPYSELTPSTSANIPIEAAQCCTIVPVSTSVKSANIGKPFPTASFFLYSADGKHVMPTFAVGELCIGGDQVAREYYKNAELTASRFMDTEFGRIYRTGDNVRMLADGTFEFIGRTDDQIKIRGLRV